MLMGAKWLIHADECKVVDPCGVSNLLSLVLLLLLALLLSEIPLISTVWPDVWSTAVDLGSRCRGSGVVISLLALANGVGLSDNAAISPLSSSLPLSPARSCASNASSSTFPSS